MKYRLGDICNIKYGKDHKHLTDGDVPCYGSGGIMRGVKKPIYEKKSVLIPRKGSLNNLYFVDTPFWTVDTLFYTEIDETKIMPEYLYYNLKMLDLARMNVGTAVPSLTTAVLNEIKLNLPSLYIQRENANTLSILDAKIAANMTVNHKLEHTAKAIFKSWFVDFEPWGGKQPSDWREGTFKDIVKTTLGGDWGKDIPIGNNTQEVYCIRGADIPDVNAGNKGKMPIRYILPRNYALKHLVDDDIVVEISGGTPRQSTGRCSLITQSLLDRYDRGIVCTNFCRAIKPKDGYSTFIYLYWCYLYDQSIMFSYENGTTGIKNLDISGFIEFESIIIPPLNLARYFDESVSKFVDTIFANALDSEMLAQIRDALLPCLMLGSDSE